MPFELKLSGGRNTSGQTLAKYQGCYGPSLLETSIYINLVVLHFWNFFLCKIQQDSASSFDSVRRLCSRTLSYRPAFSCTWISFRFSYWMFHNYFESEFQWKSSPWFALKASLFGRIFIWIKAKSQPGKGHRQPIPFSLTSSKET